MIYLCSAIVLIYVVCAIAAGYYILHAPISEEEE